MTSEELNRTMEFIVQQNAQFSVNMDQLFRGMDQLFRGMDHLSRGLNDLKEQTARFESWAAEVVAIQSRRLDQNERQLEEQRNEHRQFMQEQELLRRDIMRLLNMILDRLPASTN
jgi:hypothetical protein